MDARLLVAVDKSLCDRLFCTGTDLLRDCYRDRKSRVPSTEVRYKTAMNAGTRIVSHWRLKRYMSAFSRLFWCHDSVSAVASTLALGGWMDVAVAIALDAHETTPCRTVLSLTTFMREAWTEAVMCMIQSGCAEREQVLRESMAAGTLRHVLLAGEKAKSHVVVLDMLRLACIYADAYRDSKVFDTRFALGGVAAQSDVFSTDKKRELLRDVLAHIGVAMNAGDITLRNPHLFQLWKFAARRGLAAFFSCIYGSLGRLVAHDRETLSSAFSPLGSATTPALWTLELQERLSDAHCISVPEIFGSNGILEQVVRHSCVVELARVIHQELGCPVDMTFSDLRAGRAVRLRKLSMVSSGGGSGDRTVNIADVIGKLVLLADLVVFEKLHALLFVGAPFDHNYVSWDPDAMRAAMEVSPVKRTTAIMQAQAGTGTCTSLVWRETILAMYQSGQLYYNEYLGLLLFG